MRQFKDLILTFVDQGVAEAFAGKLQQKVADNPSWDDFSAELAERLQGRHDPEGVALYRFDYRNQSGEKVANLFLSHRPAGVLKVSNIVPDKPGSLEKQFYNFVLDKFKEEIVEPSLSELAERPEVEFTNATISPAELVTAPIADLFETFAHMANMNGLHPLDQDRWRQILIQLHVKRVELYAPQLRDLLIQNYGFPEEMTDDLVSDFENAKDLLDDYDRFKHW